ncbi:MAG: glycosyltransferase family 87 protein [Candidatus Dormibacterales bacterium]
MSSAWRRLSWVGLAVALVALSVDVLHRHDAIGIDFHTYLAAARVGLQNGWSHIYDQTLVAAEQRRLASNLSAQPYLSPPPVAWLAALLAPLPFNAAYAIWAVCVLALFALAFTWASSAHGLNRWLAVAGALSPWWVVHAIDLGQVVPLVAAGLLVASRLGQDRRDVAAGLALTVILLKPNTAILVPLVVLAAGRYRMFATWLAASAIIAVVALVSVGASGMSAYADQLVTSLPRGADYVTLHGAFGVAGWPLVLLRGVIVVAVLVTAYRLRDDARLVLALGAVGALVVSPYLHASDLCVLTAAVFLVWDSRETARWRAPIALGWLAASPFVLLTPVGAQLNRWPVLELALLLGLAATAWASRVGLTFGDGRPHNQEARAT